MAFCSNGFHIPPFQVTKRDSREHQDIKTITHLPLALSNRAPLLEPFRLATAVRLGRLPFSYWSGLHPPPLVPLPAPWRRQTVCGELSLPINYHTGTVYQSTYWTTLPAAVSSQNPVQVYVLWNASEMNEDEFFSLRLVWRAWLAPFALTRMLCTYRDTHAQREPGLKSH